MLYARIRKYGWMIIFPAAFLVYSLSFSDLPIIEQKHSVLAEGDSAAFMVIMKDFDMTKQYGDPYNTRTRSTVDVAQKHKIHHTLYIIVSGVLSTVLAAVYGVLGISKTQALYSVNALLACLNIGLLYVLLKHVSPENKNTTLLLVLYAASLNTWIFASIPESWVLSACLVLLFTLLAFKYRQPYLLLAVFVGVAMTNNIFLSTLFILLFARFLEEGMSLAAAVGRSVVGGFVALTTWATTLSLYSLFDASLSPLSYIKYTLWFKKTVAPAVRLDLRQWQVAISNNLINSVVSNQSDPVIPKKAIILTFQQSPLGIVATLIYVVLLVVMARNMLGAARASRWKWDGGGNQHFPVVAVLGFLMSWWVLTLVIDTAGSFLFAAATIPMMICLMSRYIDTGKRYQRILLYGTVAAVVINNIVQVVKFRDALKVLPV